MTTQPLALMIVSARGRRPVVAAVGDDTHVGDLAAALGAPSDAMHKLGQRLDHNAPLLQAGVRSGDTLHLGVSDGVALRQLGPELRIVGGLGVGLRRRVDGRPLVIGRDTDVDVVLTDDRVSRRHAQFAWADDHFVVRDLGSRNGVRVEGELIAVGIDVSVAPGTPVRIGDTVFTFVGAGASPTRSTPAQSFTLATPATVHARRSLAPFVVPSAGAVALAATASGAPAPVALAATPAAVVVGLLADRGMTARASRKAAAARSALLDDARSDVLDAARAFAVAERARLLDPASLGALVERKARGVWSTRSAIWSCE